MNQPTTIINDRVKVIINEFNLGMVTIARENLVTNKVDSVSITKSDFDAVVAFVKENVVEA